MKKGTIVLSDGERFSFDEHNKEDNLRIVFFALDNCVRFSHTRTSGYDWLIYPAKQSNQLGEARWRWIIEIPSGIKLYAERFHPPSWLKHSSTTRTTRRASRVAR